jgi:hypothetical protein
MDLDVEGCEKDGMPPCIWKEEKKLAFDITTKSSS